MAPYTFELFAPHNKKAGLRLKNAAARMFGLDIPMDLDEKDGYWRVTLDLPDGIYHYQYKIVTNSWFEPEPEPLLPDYTNDDTKTADENAEIRKHQVEEYDRLLQEIRERNKKRASEITFTEVWYTFVDPYATEVDERGSDDAFRSVGVLVIKNGKKVVDEYQWKYDNYTPLCPNEKLIIYEIHIGDFDNQFKNVTARMDYFVKLGITAVEVMPIKEFPGSVGWGYIPRYYFAVETSYGTTAELKEMIDEFHKNGIRVIMDGVYNHCEVSSPFTAIDHDYWFHHEPKDKMYSWGPEWDYGKYDEKYDVWPARKYIGDSVAYFINEFHTDGIRFDAAGNINHDDFLRIITKQSREQAQNRGYAPHFFCVGEYLPERIHGVLENGGPMDGIWHDSLYQTLREALIFDQVNIDILKDRIDARRQGYKSIVNPVNYQSNHDHDRLLVELGKESQIFAEDAFRRVRMAFVVQATAFGLVMIWMGEELGEYKEKTPGVAKIDWSLIADREDNSNAINKEHLQFYRDVVHLRRSNDALISPNLEYIYEHTDNKILAWYRWSTPNQDTNQQENHVVTVCNWSTKTYEKYGIFNMPKTGKWYEWLNNDKEYIVEDNKLVIDNFLAHTARIFIYQTKRSDDGQRSVA